MDWVVGGMEVCVVKGDSGRCEGDEVWNGSGEYFMAVVFVRLAEPSHAFVKSV